MHGYIDLLKEYARDYILENTGLKVLALLITAVLWLSVASRPENQITLQNVPIELRHLPESPRLTFSKVETATARVTLRGPRDVLDTLRSSDVVAIADVTGVEPGVRVIPLKLDVSRLPASVKPQGVEPRSIRITVEQEVDKEVPILPRLDGSPAQGYEVYDWRITPATIHIAGAESNVRDISQVSTETVSLSGRTETFSGQVAIDIGSSEVNIRDEGLRNVQLTVEIGEKRKERTVDRVPVVLNNGPPGAQPLPRFVKVTLFGPGSAIDALTVGDLQAVIDYQEGQEKSREFIPTIKIENYSERVVVRSVEPGKIRVR